MSRCTRRTFLRGAAGATLGLPLLESLLPAARAADRPPVRALFVFLPNGVHMSAWTPERIGADFALPPTLEPLAPFRRHLTVLSGLTLDGARAHGDGPGDHARAGAAFLTGAHPRKTDGADIHNGVSVDQVLAQAVGQATPLPSLELGCDPSAQGGNCDSGYSCAYSSNIAWSGPTTPVAKEIDPRAVFERLFLDGEGLTPDQRARRDRQRASVLDLVLDDAKRVRARLGAADRRKLEEYMEAVRALEKRLGKPQRRRSEGPPVAPPTGAAGDYGEHIRRMYDIVRLAFQTDTTRVATFMTANAGSNRSYRFLGVPEGHHDLSHHGGDAERQAKLQRINRFQVEQLAYLLEQLAAVDEGRGTLLDNTLVVFGSAIRDGDRHDHHDLPVLLCGRGGGSVHGGRHLRLAPETPLCNLYVSILQRAGARATSFGDSRGALDGL
ncbi:MAG: DUF1552 domain-containing protein [Planctomycetes bacterium]|nr:DUF1552 domain-containing protein [Planctomycetota bacterium]